MCPRKSCASTLPPPIVISIAAAIVAAIALAAAIITAIAIAAAIIAIVR